MRGKTLMVVVDADAIVARVLTADANHKQVTKIFRKLEKLKARFIYPVTGILEAVTVLQRRLNKPVIAEKTLKILIMQEVDKIQIDRMIWVKAMAYFDPNGSKKNTLFDCVVAAIAEEYKADAIFSFDKFYKKKGFKLASEL